MAARAAGEVRRDVHGAEGQRAAGPVRREPVDAAAQGGDLARSREARGDPARPAAGALGPGGGGRGAPDVGPRRVAQEPALQAGRAAARLVRPLPAVDRDPAQGRPRQLLAIPPAPRPRRLRRRALDSAGDGQGARPVLPAPHEGGDGLFP